VKSNNARLVALLVAAMLPVVTIASVLVVYVARQERRAVEAETRTKVARVVESVDREIGANLRVLEALATSANLDGPDLPAFHAEAGRVLASQPGWLTLVLADLDGWQVLSARQPFDRPPIRVIDTPSYEELLRTGRPVVGSISPPSPRTGVRAVPLRVPVMRDGRLRFVLTAPLSAEGVERLLQGSGIPADWVAAVVDREGRIIARTRAAVTYVGQPASSSARAAIATGSGSGFYRGRTLEGLDVTTAFATSPLTGWSVHAGIPQAAFEAPLRRAVLAAGLGGLGSVLLAALLAWLIQRDVVARRRHEDMLRQVQKMEVIGQMAGGMAHDFNNLLAVIRSGAGLVRRRPDDPRRDFLLDSIVEATERGAKLTRQLLTFAGRRDWQPEIVDLGQSLRATVELLRSSVRGGLAWQLDLADGLWPVEIDASELEHALLNLTVNARDAMPEGGTLRLTARNVSLPEADEHLPGLKGDHVRVTLTDSGTGMAPEIVERAFEPFFTTKELGKGTGLGLSQVYGFARQAGGAAVISSRPGAGTTVALYLPRARERATSPATIGTSLAQA
jgi:signal transduction histidine kinase